MELSTQNQRYVLLSPFPIQQIDSGGSIEKVVSHEVHELEVHSLVVSVSYTHSTGEDTVMKRSFRIPVSSYVFMCLWCYLFTIILY